MEDTMLVHLEPVIKVKDGLKLIDKTKDIPKENIYYVFHFQTVDCAQIYAICINPPNEILSKDYLYQNLIYGLYDIGVSYINRPDIITNITSYNDDQCDEIRLHYTSTREDLNNIAWRSIHWDLFE